MCSNDGNESCASGMAKKTDVARACSWMTLLVLNDVMWKPGFSALDENDP